MTRIKTTLPSTELEVATGNYDESRATIDRVIIHTMVGSWQSAAARFDDPTSKVSAHYGVKLDGGLIHWLEETFTAYHAGDYPMNQRSIGIEHEDGGDYNGIRPDTLYTASANLVRDICKFYNIPIDRDHIKKHNEVSDKPTGCPDALDIDRIVKEAQGDPLLLCEADRDTNWNAFVALCSALGTQVDANDKEKTKQDALNAIQALKDQVNQLEKDKLSLETEVKNITDSATALSNQITQIHAADSQAIDEGIKAQSDLKTVNATLGAISDALESSTTLKDMLSAIDTLKSQKPSKPQKIKLGPVLQWVYDHFPTL